MIQYHYGTSTCFEIEEGVMSCIDQCIELSSLTQSSKARFEKIVESAQLPERLSWAAHVQVKKLPYSFSAKEIHRYELWMGKSRWVFESNDDEISEDGAEVTWTMCIEPHTGNVMAVAYPVARRIKGLTKLPVERFGFLPRVIGSLGKLELLFPTSDQYNDRIQLPVIFGTSDEITFLRTKILTSWDVPEDTIHHP